MPDRCAAKSQPCPKPILDLIERFELHAETYRQQTYNETQVRRMEASGTDRHDFGI